MRRKWEEAFATVSYVGDGSHPGFASLVAARRRNPVLHAVHAPFRVRSAVRSPRILSGKSRPDGNSGGIASDADARGRYGDLASAHDASRPHRAAAHADRGSG